MATIGELVEKHSKVPGDIWVRHPDFGAGVLLRPYFHCPYQKCWYGSNEVGNAMVVSDALNANFELYIKPKTKVKKWLWVYEMGITGPTWYITCERLTEQDAQAQFGAWPLAKIEQSVREFPADDTDPEPVKKAKVKRWLWADENGNMSSDLLSEEERKYANKTLIRKLLWSETEFDEN